MFADSKPWRKYYCAYFIYLYTFTYFIFGMVDREKIFKRKFYNAVMYSIIPYEMKHTLFNMSCIYFLGCYVKISFILCEPTTVSDWLTCEKSGKNLIHTYNNINNNTNTIYPFVIIPKSKLYEAYVSKFQVLLLNVLVRRIRKGVPRATIDTSLSSKTKLLIWENTYTDSRALKRVKCAYTAITIF